MQGDPKANEYGVSFAEYNGRGTLQMRQGHDAPCRFRTFQLRNGHVIVLCTVEEPESMFTYFDAAQNPSGTAHDGRSLTARALSETNYLPDNPGPETCGVCGVPGRDGPS